MPPAKPLTIAAELEMALTLAIVVSLLLQMPPDIVSVKVSLVPAQSEVVPIIRPGDGMVLTVTVAVAEATPQAPDTV